MHKAESFKTKSWLCKKVQMRPLEVPTETEHWWFSIRIWFSSHEESKVYINT